MKPNHSNHAIQVDGLSRRRILRTMAATSMTLALPRLSFGAAASLKKPVRIGLIADLHHDVMHDGPDRLDVFLKQMSISKPDAIMQLGDFAYPTEANAPVIDRFNQAHEQSLHVIGNHDTDAGCTTAQCIERWGMPARHYVQNIGGLHMVVLDGNDPGSPTYKSGYKSYVGKEQVAWLKEQLATLDGPIIVACHQPLAGAYAVDNAEEIQSILGDAADKVILAINGHSHIDQVVRVKNVTYLHVNSASYKWVGGDNRHESYSKDIHEAHPWISCTCPYRDPLFAMLTIDPDASAINVEGTSTTWVGQSPAELGLDLHPELINGEQIAPRIRDRSFHRAKA
ncbi:MAG: metallophosphoesterase [Phycisphaerales bacterium]|nr:metallophosphoesterase [Phycisphaerales bacterium]